MEISIFSSMHLIYLVIFIKIVFYLFVLVKPYNNLNYMIKDKEEKQSNELCKFQKKPNKCFYPYISAKKGYLRLPKTISICFPIRINSLQIIFCNNTFFSNTIKLFEFIINRLSW